MTDLYVNHEATLPPSLDLDVIPMSVVQTSPLLVREANGTRNLAAFNGVPNWVHVPGDPVMVRKSTMTVESSLAVRPQSGTVTVVAGTLITLSALGQTWQARSGTSAPAVGNTVALSWGSEGAVVVAVISGAIPAPAGTAPPVLPSGSTPTVLPPFRPTSSGSYRSGALRGDTSNLFQGHWVAPANSNDNTGVVTYGDVWGAVRGKTVAVATATVIRGPVGSGSNSAVTVHLKTHNVTSLPSATPALNASTNNTLALAPNQSGVVDITAMVQEIANGTAAGLAVTFVGTSDYAMFLGVGSTDSFVINVTVQ